MTTLKLALAITEILVGIFILLVTGCQQSGKAISKEAELLVAKFDQLGLDDVPQVERAIEAATQFDSAVIFINLDWSLDCALGRRQFAQFSLDYAKQFSDRQVEFCYIDSTVVSQDYSVYRRLPGWDELEQKQQATIAGHGEVVWIRNGTVVAVGAIRESKDSGEFARKTNRLFGG